jgi:hypothetical protein
MRAEGVWGEDPPGDFGTGALQSQDRGGSGHV